MHLCARYTVVFFHIERRLNKNVVLVFFHIERRLNKNIVFLKKQYLNNRIFFNDGGAIPAHP